MYALMFEPENAIPMIKRRAINCQTVVTNPRPARANPNVSNMTTKMSTSYCRMLADHKKPEIVNISVSVCIK